MPDPFAVIPSTVFVAPLAVLAALFPATFAGLASGFKRWRAFLMVVSVNGLLAATYFFLREYALLPDSPLAGPTAAAAYLLAVVALGLIWAGRRYRLAAKLDPTVTDPPTRRDVLAVLGFAAASLVVVVGVAWVANWVTTGSARGVPFGELLKLLFDLPTRELTSAIAGLVAAAGYLAYRAATRHADGPGPVRLSAPGEAVALTAMLVFGTVTVVNSVPRTGAATTAVETSSDTVVSSPPIKLTDAAVWFETAEMTEAFSAVAVTPDRVLLGGMRRKGFESAGVLVCVDRATGKQAWVYTDADMKTVYSTPVVAGGRVFVGEGLHTDPDCRLLCLDAATGQKLWEKRTTSHTEGSPAVADGKVYFSAGDDGLYCLTTDGAEVWHFRGREQGLHVDSPVVVAHGRVYAGSGYQTLAAFALDAATGQPVWRKELTLRSFGQPLVLGDRVIYGLGTGNLSYDLSTEPEPGRANEVKPAGAVVCLNAATGDEVWKCDLPRSVHTQLSADGRAVFAACRDGWVYALSRTDGRQLWRFSYAQPLTTGTTAAAYTKFGFGVAVYAVSPAGNVYAHDPLSGKLLWSRDVRQLAEREVEVMAPPTLVAPADGGERQVFVPVSLTHRTTGAKTAAVVRFVDRFAEPPTPGR
jgi:outer membrane protein assembly factor BamB